MTPKCPNSYSPKNCTMLSVGVKNGLRPIFIIHLALHGQTEIQKSGKLEIKFFGSTFFMDWEKIKTKKNNSAFFFHKPR